MSEAEGFVVALDEASRNLLLAQLMRAARWPLVPPVFGALVSMAVSVPLELCVMDKKGRVLTFYRKDSEYDGHHMPGTVLRDNENVEQALNRLVTSEVVGGEISDPVNVGWIEIPKGSGEGWNPTRHEISLLWMAYLRGEYHGKNGVFSPMDALPPNTLSHHRVLIEKFKKALKTGKPILGY
ncbi:MAG: NUDIX hydrolase [Candidatus Liptonbacteria bacterium]|nr:NUDIX hydrolase [Candidatus Liptonbacteria bacterium]